MHLMDVFLQTMLKIHLFNSERETLIPGKELVMFELNGIKIGIMDLCRL